MALDFGEVLGKAWRIIWKHKVLWIFGIFAGCGRGGGGGGGGSGWEQSQPFSFGPSADIEGALQQASQWISDHLWVVLLIVLALLALWLVSLFLGTVGRIGLIRGTLKADTGAERIAFGGLFRESLPFFWRVFLLNLLVGLAFLIVVLLFITPVTVLGILTAGIGLLCLLPLLCLLIPVSLAVGILLQLANPAMVIENVGMMDGVRRGLEVARRNLGPVLLIWLITGVIGIAVGIVLLIPILVIVFPAFLAAAASQEQLPTPLVVAGVCIVVYLPVLLVLGGVLTAYIQSVWALTYLRLAGPREARSSLEALPSNA